MCFLVPAAGRLPMRQSAPLSRRRCLQRCLLILLEKVCEGWHSCSWTLPCQDISYRMTRRYIVDLYRPNFWPAKEFLMSVRARKWNPTKFVEKRCWNYIFCERWIAFLSLTLRTSMDQYGVYRRLVYPRSIWRHDSVNGNDKMSRDEAETRTCDVTRDTRPVSTL